MFQHQAKCPISTGGEVCLCRFESPSFWNLPDNPDVVQVLEKMLPADYTAASAQLFKMAGDPPDASLQNNLPSAIGAIIAQYFRAQGLANKVRRDPLVIPWAKLVALSLEIGLRIGFRIGRNMVSLGKN